MGDLDGFDVGLDPVAVVELTIAFVARVHDAVHRPFLRLRYALLGARSTMIGHPSRLAMGDLPDGYASRRLARASDGVVAARLPHEGADDEAPVGCRAHEEGAADLIALVTSLHFAAVVDRLLATTQGNLFSPNVLARIGELGRTRYARSVFNRQTLSDVVWARLLGDKHALSLPFTGAAFDVLVEIYEQGLVARGAISEALGGRSVSARHPRDVSPIQREFRRCFRRRPRAFREALVEARGRLRAAPCADGSRRPRGGCRSGGSPAR